MEFVYFERYWPKVYISLLLFGSLFSWSLVIYLSSVGKFPFALISGFIAVSITAAFLFDQFSIPLFRHTAQKPIIIDPRILLFFFFIFISATIFSVHQTGWSLLTHVLFAGVIGTATLVILSDRTLSATKAIIIILVPCVAALSSQIDVSAGIWEPDTELFHVPITSYILQTGHFSMEGVYGNRQLFPAHHVLVAIASRLTSFGAFDTYLILSTAIIAVGCLIIWQLAGQYIPLRTAGIAALVVPAADYSHYIITHPSKLVFGYITVFSGIYYIHFYSNISVDNFSRTLYTIGYVFIFTIIVTIHPFSAIVATFLITLFGLLSAEKRIIFASFVFIVGFYGYFTHFDAWAGLLSSAIVDVISVILADTSTTQLQGATRYASIPVYQLVFQTVGQAIMLGVGVLGGIYFLQDPSRLWKNRYPIIVTLSIIFLAAVGSLFSLRYVLPQRWYLVGYFFGLNILFTVALRRLNLRHTAVIGMTLLALFAPMTAIAGYQSAHFYDQPYYKSYNTPQEISAGEWTEYIDDGIVYGPFPDASNSEIYNQDGTINMSQIPPDGVLLFSDEYEKSGLVREGSGSVVGATTYFRPKKNGLGISNNRIYDSGNVSAYK